MAASTYIRNVGPTSQRFKKRLFGPCAFRIEKLLCVDAHGSILQTNYICEAEQPFKKTRRREHRHHTFIFNKRGAKGKVKLGTSANMLCCNSWMECLDENDRCNNALRNNCTQHTRRSEMHDICRTCINDANLKTSDFMCHRPRRLDRDENRAETVGEMMDFYIRTIRGTHLAWSETLFHCSFVITSGVMRRLFRASSPRQNQCRDPQHLAQPQRNFQTRQDGLSTSCFILSADVRNTHVSMLLFPFSSLPSHHILTLPVHTHSHHIRSKRDCDNESRQ